MKQKTIIDQIIDGASEHADVDVGVAECFDLYCQEHGIDDTTRDAALQEYTIREASMAGIPLSVILGKTKLSDHFSEGYINWKCNRVPERDEE